MCRGVSLSTLPVLLVGIQKGDASQRRLGCAGFGDIVGFGGCGGGSDDWISSSNSSVPSWSSGSNDQDMDLGSRPTQVPPTLSIYVIQLVLGEWRSLGSGRGVERRSGRSARSTCPANQTTPHRLQAEALVAVEEDVASRRHSTELLR